MVFEDGRDPYLDTAIPRTGTRDKASGAAIGSVHADAGAGRGAAALLDAALNVRGTWAIASQVEALGCAIGGLLACSCSVLSRESVMRT